MIYLHTLGTACIDAGDVRVTPKHARKFALLLRLGSTGDQPVPRSELDQQIFPDFSRRNAGHSMRDLVYRLRGDGFQIDLTTELVALAAGGALTDYDEILRRDRLTDRDLAAVTSGFLPGYDPSRMEAFSEWLAAYRARTTMALCRAMAKQIAVFRSVGDWTMTEQTARACLSLDPMNEEATLALAEMLALGGAKLKAVRLLDEYMHGVGGAVPDLRLPAAVLRRRISERLPLHVRSSKPMPFVGRDREMLLLRERFMAIKDGRSQCVVISGEPGMGKSRLALEFSNLAALEGAHIERASAQPHDVHRPMGALADLVPGLLQEPGALGCAPESMQALRRLTNRGDQPVEYRLDDAQTSEALYFSITRAVTDLIDAVSAERPLVLFVEDMHWVDDVSIRILGQIAAGKPRRRVLVLFTSRERLAATAFPAHADSVLQVELERLDDSAVDRLIAAESAIARVAHEEGMRRWLRTTSGGNPLFFQSLVAHFVDTGQRFSVPSTLLSLLEQRVARMSEPAALTLQMCVLFGKYATIERIEEAVHLPRAQLLSAFSELERARLVEATGDEVRPAHGLIADAAVQRFSAIENRMAHRYAAEVLERVAASTRTPSVVWDCAEHWVAAEDRERAVVTLRRCAELSLEVGRPRGAAEALLRATEVVGSNLEREELARSAVLSAVAAGEAVLTLNAVDMIATDLDLSRNEDLEFARFEASVRLYRDRSDTAQRMLESVKSASATARHRVRAATLLLKHADVIGTTSMAESAIGELPTAVLEQVDEVARLEFELIAASICGRHDQAVGIASRLGNVTAVLPPSARSHFEMNCSLANWRAGRSGEAIEFAFRAHEAAVSCGSHRSSLNTALMLLGIYTDIWQDDEAGHWMRRAEEIASATAELKDEPAFIIMKIDVGLALNNLHEADEAFVEADNRKIFDASILTSRWRRVFVAEFAMRNGVCTDEQLANLLQPGKITGPMSGLRDSEIAAACSNLTRRGRAPEARRIFSDYLVQRMSRAPLARSLEQARRSLAQASLCEEKEPVLTP